MTVLHCGFQEASETTFYLPSGTVALSNSHFRYHLIALREQSVHIYPCAAAQDLFYYLVSLLVPILFTQSLHNSPKVSIFILRPCWVLLDGSCTNCKNRGIRHLLKLLRGKPWVEFVESVYELLPIRDQELILSSSCLPNPETELKTFWLKQKQEIKQSVL